MIKRSDCLVLYTAEEISENYVDCASKNECNGATSCPLFSRFGNWEELIQHFVNIDNWISEIEKELLENHGGSKERNG